MMLFRFSLYGFLKNQRYFEPFLVYAFIEKGLSFSQIGLLIGFREISISVLEIPTGVIADVYGRRRSMVYSTLAYMVSFLAFAYSHSLWQLFAAMLLFAVGDAFRTGTHKAIILDWLRLQGREGERTKMYGYTRSWSKIGSAVMAPLAALLALLSAGYSRIFLFSIVPYTANLINLATYPAYLDGERSKDASLRKVARHTWDAARHIFGSAGPRRMIVESLSYDGIYASVKDYVQPVIRSAAVALPLLAMSNLETRTKVLAGAVYFALEMLGATASRLSHRASNASGGEDRAARALWLATFTVYAAMLPMLYFRVNAGMICGFIVLAALHNVWRPIMISRIDKHSSAEYGATVLSVDSQAKSGFVALAAPLVGFLVDLVNRGVTEPGAKTFWPVAAFGLAVMTLILATSRASSAKDKQAAVGPRSST